MNNLVKSTMHGRHRVHASTANHAPVCGGGFQARTANWQEDIGGVTCKRCLTILENRNTPPRRINANRKV